MTTIWSPTNILSDGRPRTQLCRRQLLSSRSSKFCPAADIGPLPTIVLVQHNNRGIVGVGGWWDVTRQMALWGCLHRPLLYSQYLPTTTVLLQRSNSLCCHHICWYFWLHVNQRNTQEANWFFSWQLNPIDIFGYHSQVKLAQNQKNWDDHFHFLSQSSLAFSFFDNQSPSTIFGLGNCLSAHIKSRMDLGAEMRPKLGNYPPVPVPATLWHHYPLAGY